MAATIEQGLRAWAATLAAALLLLAAAPAARAGRSCEPRPASAEAVQRGLELAARTQATLQAEYERHGTQVLLLARAGQDLRRYGLRWSHLGFAYRQPVDGQWRVLHKLNACGSAEAALYRQGLAQFFLDDPWRYEAAWAPLAPTVQARLLPLLTDNDRAKALHERRYSLVAYAWGQRYQQSNQWVIETLALAMEPGVGTRGQAQAWLKLQGYRPTVLRIDALTRLGAHIGQANVAFDDHPDGERFSDRIATVTADSVFGWLLVSGLGAAPNVLQLP